MKRCSLVDALDYQHKHVVDRHQKHFDVPLEDSNLLFEQLKAWLWLNHELECDRTERSGSTELPPHIPIYYFQLPLDSMWHTFLLFSRDYADFCESRFGKFMHHLPEIHDENEGERAAGQTGKLKEDMRSVMNYVFNKLGAEVTSLWFDKSSRLNTIPVGDKV